MGEDSYANRQILEPCLVMSWQGWKGDIPEFTGGGVFLCHGTVGLRRWYDF